MIAKSNYDQIRVIFTICSIGFKKKAFMSENLVLKTIDISSLVRVLNLLETFVPQAKSDLEKAGLIQHFEMVYELIWKIMKKVLTQRGIEVLSPRETFRLAGMEKLIENSEIWFDFIQKRNLTFHIYDQRYAEEVISFLPIFIQESKKFIEKIKSL